MKNIIGFILGVVVAGSIFYYIQPSSTEATGGEKFQWAVELLERDYVDSISVDSLIDELVPELIDKLDPHSEYIPAKNLGAINESIEGKFDGIGVVFNMATDTAIVLSVITGGPGYKEGIEPGDRVITVNDTTIAGVKMDQMDVVGRLRGKRGTKVELGIMRGSSDELIDFTLVRDVIPINSVEAEFLTRDNAGYIRINTFAEHTYIDAIMAINRLYNQGAESLVIDLRGNGGGLLDQAILLANEFLSEGQGIVYVEGKNLPKREQFADGRGAFQSIPLYVLIDEASASASEIFAGAIQDNDRGIIIGRRSFGKGSVQQQIPYEDGSAIRLTIAKYYTPLGRAVQKPYELGNEDSYNQELINRYKKDGELSTGINDHIDSTQTYVTAKGRVLFGGGGITPDEVVVVDTTDLPDYFLELFEKNAIFKFSQSFSDTHRKEINSIKTIEELDTFYGKYPSLYNQLIDYAATRLEVPRPSAKSKEQSRELVDIQLRAYIGRNTSLQESASYYYLQLLDDTTLKLSEIIRASKAE